MTYVPPSAERHIENLEMAAVGYARATAGGEGHAAMALTLLCLVLRHPTKHHDDPEDAPCFCGVRK